MKVRMWPKELNVESLRLSVLIENGQQGWIKGGRRNVGASPYSWSRPRNRSAGITPKTKPVTVGVTNVMMSKMSLNPGIKAYSSTGTRIFFTVSKVTYAWRIFFGSSIPSMVKTGCCGYAIECRSVQTLDE